MSRFSTLAALLLLGATALAQSPTTTTTLPVKQTTEVKGDVPADLVGRWLAVGLVKLPDGTVRPAPRTLEIRRGTDQLELFVSLHPLPAAVNQKVNAAAEAGTAWAPDADDLRVVDESWTDPATVGSADLTGVANRITAADAYPPEYKADATTRDSKVAILVQENYTGRTAALRSISIYGIRKQTATTLEGTFINTTLAAAPIPIPITFGGDFIAYRIGKAAGGSWLDGLFSGCRR